MEYVLQKEKLQITVAERGAEIVSVKYAGKEREWQNENGGWSGHAPVLFPVCGAYAVRVNGRDYPCPRHGFAMNRVFTLVEKAEDRLRFRLCSDEESKKLYPFDFSFDVEYRISDDKLCVAYEVKNEGESDLYFSCGGHDSFALAAEPKNYELEFEKEEVFESLLVNEAGYLTGETRFLSAGKILDLDSSLLDFGSSICLDKLRSGKVLLREKGTHRKIVQVIFPQSEKLVLWRPHGAKMLCIEPWQNLPDRASGEDAEFSAKDGVIKVPPHGSERVIRTVKYYDE